MPKPWKKHKKGHVKGGLHELQIVVKETYNVFFSNTNILPPPENSCGKFYMKIWILKAGVEGPGGFPPVRPFLRSRYVYRIFHMNFPKGALGHREIFEKILVFFLYNNLQLV